MSERDALAVMRERGLRMAQAVVAFVLFLAVAQAVLLLLGDASTQASLLATAAGGTAVLVMFAAASEGSRFGPLRAAKQALLGYPLFLALWAPLLLFVYPWLLRACGERFPPQPLLQMIADGGQPAATQALVLFGVCLFGPLVEEVLFRGYVQTALRGVFGVATGLILTSALFGLVHGAVYAVPTGLLGLWFGWLRERTGGLFAPFVAHALHNSVTVAVVLCWPGMLDSLYDR